MSRQLFGTDGIRGIAGEPPLDARTAHALGVALGEWSKVSGHQKGGLAEVLIGMDTRESGPWLAAQVAGGLASSGVSARFAGVITTPGVAYLTRTGPFAAGVMISASHNPYHDNGLKVISHSGYKLPDDTELDLENRINAWLGSGEQATAKALQVDESLDNAYTDYLAGTVSGSFPFHLVIDCANGSAAHVAPRLFPRLGCQIEWLAVCPDGRNINLNCGSLHLESLQKRVLESGADLGVAFDGDADRALFVSGSGKVVDGDAVLFLAGSDLKRAGKLAGDVVVATVMSNLGLETALRQQGIRMLRTPVGDKYVLEEMLKRGAVLGGEQSGHVIFSQYATTGDGLLTALRVLEIVRDSGQSLDELSREVKTFPQKLVNVRVKHKRPLTELETVQAEIAAAEREFGGTGRVVVRFSGTEPLARVMIEAESDEQVDRWTGRIAEAIRAELGAAG
ncbi:MAG TPA: phosphoglucosamine mutase [Bryobacteraceae bacterium]|jgi:phosphoglucosamine mutase|nr:phosphoglucosamine mutase [Bryobacteraceae bacterium]